MLIHSPDLEKALSKYISDNRGKEENLNLRILRAYKIVFLLYYYAQALAKTEGDLQKLTIARMHFWHKALESVLESRSLEDGEVAAYLGQRDSLRSEEEKKRQKEFAKS